MPRRAERKGLTDHPTMPIERPDEEVVEVGVEALRMQAGVRKDREVQKAEAVLCGIGRLEPDRAKQPATRRVLPQKCVGGRTAQEIL